MRIIFLLLLVALNNNSLTAKEAPVKQATKLPEISTVKAVVPKSPSKQSTKLQEKVEQTPAPETPKKEMTRAERKASKRTSKKETPFVNHTAIKHMSLKELGPAKEQYLQQGKKQFAASCIERMITLENDQHKQQALRLELGNLYLDLGKFVNAEVAYKNFISMYPNSSDIELVYFRAIESAWRQTLTHDRDQTKTKDCLEAAEKYLNNEGFKKYRKEIEEISKQCYKKLLDHEGYICRFYIKKAKNKTQLKGAEQRAEYARTQYMSKVPDGEHDVLVLECELAKAKNDHELHTQKATELAQKFPHYKKPVEQQEHPESSRKRYATRF